MYGIWDLNSRTILEIRAETDSFMLSSKRRISDNFSGETDTKMGSDSSAIEDEWQQEPNTDGVLYRMRTDHWLVQS
ncbi:hypothetical protein L2E82_33711 [Cichorium intybus]|uniref:Uncharacterized protein n=1 Tax=Cichorium intybus TaxID=13427 RepID=A0ACB9BL10_CICIN|nr:hypothetical protein L2E82_33711 [Cichorium intybus]